MMGLISLLAGEVIYEGIRFVAMILLLVAAVALGGKLKMASDARKAEKEKEESDTMESSK